jgi:hypothetical protein
VVPTGPASVILGHLEARELPLLGSLHAAFLKQTVRQLHPTYCRLGLELRREADVDLIYLPLINIVLLAINIAQD